MSDQRLKAIIGGGVAVVITMVIIVVAWPNTTSFCYELSEAPKESREISFIKSSNTMVVVKLDGYLQLTAPSGNLFVSVNPTIVDSSDTTFTALSNCTAIAFALVEKKPATDTKKLAIHISKVTFDSRSIKHNVCYIRDELKVWNDFRSDNQHYRCTTKHSYTCYQSEVAPDQGDDVAIGELNIYSLEFESGRKHEQANIVDNHYFECV